MNFEVNAQRRTHTHTHAHVAVRARQIMNKYNVRTNEDDDDNDENRRRRRLDLDFCLRAYAPACDFIIPHHQITRAFAVHRFRATIVCVSVLRWHVRICRRTQAAEAAAKFEQNGRETICMRHVIRIRTFNDETE